MDGMVFGADGMAYAGLMVPAVIAGVYSGRSVFPHLPQRLFLVVVLVMAGLGALRLLAP